MEIRLQEFIRKTIEEITSGLPDKYVVDDTIDFEVSVTTSTNKSGGLEIKILSAEISKENELVQKVFFSVINQKDKEQSDKRAVNNTFKLLDKGIKYLGKHSDQQNKEQKLT